MRITSLADDCRRLALSGVSVLSLADLLRQSKLMDEAADQGGRIGVLIIRRRRP